jgi:hypothetical protein
MPDLILETSEIPTSLWDPETNLGGTTPNGVLSLPGQLAEAYRETLEELGLMQQAQDVANRDEGCIGGVTEQESRDHFAWNYSGSCGRTELFYLDPHQTFKTTRDAVVSLFSGGYATILDIPSGAGSGTATLFSLIAQLREEGVLPRIDLEVQVVGGDISQTSRIIADSLFERMRENWLEVGILVDHRFYEWDVTSDESTGDLVNAWSSTFDGRPGLLLGNNFSGFLAQPLHEGSNKLQIDECQSQIRQILTTVSRNSFSTFWIEPANNDARRRLLPRLSHIVKNNYKRIGAVPGNNLSSSSANLLDPVVSDGHFAVRSTGIHLERTS